MADHRNPFEAFDLINYCYGTEPLDQVDIIESIRIEGNLTSTFYIDDVRLLTVTRKYPPYPNQNLLTLFFRTGLKPVSTNDFHHNCQAEH